MYRIIKLQALQSYDIAPAMNFVYDFLGLSPLSDSCLLRTFGLPKVRVKYLYADTKKYRAIKVYVRLFLSFLLQSSNKVKIIIMI